MTCWGITMIFSDGGFMCWPYWPERWCLSLAACRPARHEYAATLAIAHDSGALISWRRKLPELIRPDGRQQNLSSLPQGSLEPLFCGKPVQLVLKLAPGTPMVVNLWANLVPTFAFGKMPAIGAGAETINPGVGLVCVNQAVTQPETISPF